MKRTFSFIVASLICISSIAGDSLPSTVIGKSHITYFLKGSGIPVIVFVSGMAHGHDTWKAVQESVSSNTMTISYDRAGLGTSEYHGEKKDLTSLANELHQLLQNISLPSPYILVGHSMGSQIVKKYASLYPSEVKGLVFVDPGYNEDLLKAKISLNLWEERNAMIQKYQIEFSEAQEQENVNRNKICEEADAIKKMPDVPVVMLTATMVTGFPASSIEQEIKKERHLLRLKNMPGAKHVLVDKSWHYIHTDAPEVVVSAIESVIKE